MEGNLKILEINYKCECIIQVIVLLSYLLWDIYCDFVEKKHTCLFGVLEYDFALATSKVHTCDTDSFLALV